MFHAPSRVVARRCRRERILSRKVLWLLSIPIVLLSWRGLTVHSEEHARLAPYPEIRWSDDVPQVRLDGNWVVLVAIDDQPVAEIVAFAKVKYRSRWRKRFDEDLVEVLHDMGKPLGRTVRLVVRDVGGASDRILPAVLMTEANRRAIMLSKSGASLLRAVADFEAALDERWSYRWANDADYGSALAALRGRLQDGMGVPELGVELQRIVALGLDGHAEVRGHEFPGGSYLPFLVEPVGDRFVAFHVSRDAWLADGHPFVTAIDGEEIGVWLKRASSCVPKGSPQYVRRNALRVLRHIGFLRGLRGAVPGTSVSVTLVSDAGTDATTIQLPVATRRPTYGVWPRSRSHLRHDGIGYLRLPTFSGQDALAEIRTWMPRFRDTRGLVVDVRDNGGGTRDALLLLYAFLVPAESRPLVASVAAYRLHAERGKDHLRQRYMVSRSDPSLDDAARSAIDAFASGFSPEWKPPQGDFSDWHYLLVGPRQDGGTIHYDRPVVVLMNEKCFSATDVFLAGIRLAPRVTLLGTPSSGGSALVESVPLGSTGLELRIGSMASYQVDGRLFDGHGVRPDVHVEPTPAYFVGGPDNVLEAAVEQIELSERGGAPAAKKER